MVMARVQPGKRAELASALERAVRRDGRVRPAVFGFRRPDGRLELAVAPGVGPRSPGAGRRLPVCGSHRGAVPARRRLAGRASMRPPVVAMAAGDDAPPVEFAGMIGMKYLFLEQRAPAGAEENEVTLVFQGARTGMASWLADAGSGGAAEYLPADALLAGYVSTREPWQLFEEFTALMTRQNASFAGRPGRGEREARRGLHREPDGGDGNRGGLRAERVLRQRPDVGDGRAWRTTRRSSTARSRSWWTRSTRSLRPKSRTSGSCSGRRARADGSGAR